MTTGTAVYGTVRTVVWEDGGREPSSYPIDDVLEKRVREIIEEGKQLLLSARLLQAGRRRITHGETAPGPSRINALD